MYEVMSLYLYQPLMFAFVHPERLASTASTWKMLRLFALKSKLGNAISSPSFPEIPLYKISEINLL